MADPKKPEPAQAQPHPAQQSQPPQGVLPGKGADGESPVIVPAKDAQDRARQADAHARRQAEMTARGEAPKRLVPAEGPAQVMAGVPRMDADNPPPPPIPPETPVKFDPNPGAPEFPSPVLPDQGEAVEVEWAADLVRELDRRGTGAAKLDVIRRAMRDRFGHPDHADKDETDADRHLTAREALAALEASPDVPQATKDKARSLVEFGRVVPVKTAGDPMPAPPKGKAPQRKLPGQKQAPKADQPNQAAGVDRPGVGQTGAGGSDLPAVGARVVGDSAGRR
jgi:hypothetical protein